MPMYTKSYMQQRSQLQMVVSQMFITAEKIKNSFIYTSNEISTAKNA